MARTARPESHKKRQKSAQKAALEAEILTIVRKRKEEGLPLEVKEEVAKRRHKGGPSAATIYNRLNGLRSQRELGVEQEKSFPEEHAVLIAQAVDNARRNHPDSLPLLTQKAKAMIQNRPGFEGDPQIGKNWARRLVERAPELRMHWSTNVDDVRSRALNPTNVKEFFNVLEDLHKEYHFLPEDIHGFDESPFMLGRLQRERVVGEEGAKRQKKAAAGDRETCTIAICISANGALSMEPFLIFAGVRLRVAYGSANSTGASLNTSDSGSMNAELSLAWIQLFDERTQPADLSRHRLLHLDTHTTHITYEFLDYAIKHNIHALGYIPNSTDVSQGLDVAVFSPMKHYLNEEKSRINADKPGHGMNRLNLISCLKGVLDHSCTPENVRTAFRVTGCWPVDRSQIISRTRISDKQTSFAHALPSAPVVSAVVPLIEYLETRRPTASQPRSPTMSPRASTSAVQLTPRHGQQHGQSTSSASVTPQQTALARDIREAIAADSSSAWLLLTPSRVTSACIVPSPVVVGIPSTPPSARRALLSLSTGSAHTRTARIAPAPQSREELEAALVASREENNTLRQAGRLYQTNLQHARRVSRSSNAQLAVQDIALKQQRKQLYGKEESRRNSARDRLLPTKLGRHFTGATFMQAAREDAQNRDAKIVKSAKAARRKKLLEKKRRWRKREEYERGLQRALDLREWGEDGEMATENSEGPPRKPKAPHREKMPPELKWNVERDEREQDARARTQAQTGVTTGSFEPNSNASSSEESVMN